ncbi:MAG: MFS transporter [Gammaproteobacteria bacterium]|nr:MFS transporter [Gammaproteobacteria bacterium]
MDALVAGDTMPEAGAGRVGRVRIALYGAANLPTSVVGLPIALYVPAFYSQNLGLSLAAVGALLALSRLTDVVTDPLIGILSDRWRTPFGRRKPWMVAGTPLMVLSLWMLFVPDSAVSIAVWSALGGSGVDNLYLFVWISALYLSFTLVDLPYRAWGAELSPDYDERSRVTGWREAFGYGGTMMSLIIPLAIAFGLARPGAENALYGVAFAVLVLMPLLTFPAIAFVREPPIRGVTTPHVTWARGLKIVWGNGPFRRLVICLTFFATGISMTASMSFFFVQRVMEQAFDRYAIFVLAYYISSTVAIPVWFHISKKLGKHRTVVLGIAWLSLWSSFIPLLGPDDFALFFVIMLLKGSAIGALVFLPTSMAADIVDLDTLRTREQRTGLYFSLWGMVNKGATALGVFIATAGAAYMGFDPQSEANDATAKMSVALLYSIIPAIIACIALPLLWRYPLNRDRQERMRGFIERRDARMREVAETGTNA